MRSSVFITVLLLLGSPSSPTSSAQDWVVAYTAAQLQCGRFLETGESSIHTQSGGRTRKQTSLRRARWQFRAGPAEAGIALEAWLDSLVVTRTSPEATVSPDTDGLLGGRYRGVLTRVGKYISEVRPFIPDEVAEVAGMGSALHDFFPPLPPRQLSVGEQWSNSRGLTIRRLADSALSGLPLFRFGLELREETRVNPSRDDSTAVPHRQVSQERGTFVWHPTLGLVHRDRTIVLETIVPVSRAVRRPVRSRVEQEITVARDLTGDPTVCRNEGTR